MSGTENAQEALHDLPEDVEEDAPEPIPTEVLQRARQDPVRWAEDLTTIDGEPPDFSGEFRYLKEPLRAVVDPDTERIHMWVWGRGVGKTKQAAFAKGFVGSTRRFSDTLAASARKKTISSFAKRDLRRMFRTSRPDMGAPILMDLLKDSTFHVESNEFKEPPEGPGGLMETRTAWGDGESLQGFHGEWAVGDEIQQWNMRAISNLREAVSKGMRRILFTGTPDFPGTPYHDHWEDSTQHEWFFACPECDTRQTVTLDSAEKYQYDPARYRLICRSCSEPVDKEYILLNGEWEATNDRALHRGYHFPQLISPRHDLTEVMLDWERPGYSKQDFYNFKLARFYAGGARPIPQAAINTVSDPDFSVRATAHPDYAHVAGIDWGGGNSADTVVWVGHVTETTDKNRPKRFHVDTVERVAADRPVGQLRQVAEIIDRFNLGTTGRVVADAGADMGHNDSLQNGDSRVETIPKGGWGTNILGARSGNVKREQDRYDYLIRDKYQIKIDPVPWANKFIDLFPEVQGYDSTDHADAVDHDVERTPDAYITLPGDDDHATVERMEYYHEHLTNVKREYAEKKKTGSKDEYFTTFNSDAKDDAFYASTYGYIAAVLGPRRSRGGSVRFTGRTG